MSWTNFQAKHAMQANCPNLSHIQFSNTTRSEMHSAEDFSSDWLQSGFDALQEPVLTYNDLFNFGYNI